MCDYVIFLCLQIVQHHWLIEKSYALRYRDTSYSSENLDSFILGLTYLHTRISKFRLTSIILGHLKQTFQCEILSRKVKSESPFEILLKDVYNQFWFFEIKVQNDKRLLI